MPEPDRRSGSVSVPPLPSELGPLDHLLFRTESDPRNRSAGMGVEILDRVPEWPRLVEAFDRASRVLVRLRQKVVVPIVGLSAPRWVIDPDFDLEYHVRRLAVPAPGTLRQVLDMALPMLEGSLDTARALWEVTLVEGMQDGRAALLTKMSHALTDGVGGMQLIGLIYDGKRKPPQRPMPPAPPPEDLTPEDLTRQALVRLPAWAMSTTSRQLASLVRAAGRAARAPTRTMSDAVAYVQSVRRVIVGGSVEPSPLLQRRSLASRLEVHEVPVDALRRAGRAAGCTVNDAYVAAVCGVMRRYHEALSVPVEALSVAIPVNLRTSADPAGGNRFGGARLRVPVGEPDPVERMRIIHEQVHRALEEPGLAVVNVLAPVVSRIPTPMLTVMARAFENIDVQASNVAGDPRPRYIAGARTERHYAFGPLPGVPMMVTMLTMAGTACIGVRYDRAAVSQFDLFARCLREGFDEVVEVGSR